MHHMRYIPEQLVQLAHRLLDIPDLGLALDDEGFLKVDLALVGENGLLLLELLLRLSAFLRWRGHAFLFEGGSLCGGRGTLLLERLPLQALKLGEGGFEFGVEFVLRVLL